jgi:hypothetical protein
MTMLECCKDGPGDSLIFLLQKLMKVDLHRRALAEQNGEAYFRAAGIDAKTQFQGLTPESERTIAKRLGVSHTTVGVWRASVDYQRLVEFNLVGLREAFRDETCRLRTRYPDISEGEIAARVLHIELQNFAKSDPEGLFLDTESALMRMSDTKSLEVVWRWIDPAIEGFHPRDRERWVDLFRGHYTRIVDSTTKRRRGEVLSRRG